MTLRAAVDESDITQSPYYVIAGWVAEEEVWDRLSVEWEATLAELPSAEFFRSNSAAGFKGPFEGWSEQARNCKVSNLALAISRHKVLGIAAYVNKQVFADHIGSISKKGYRDPYFICALAIVSLCQRTFTEHEIHFVFDKHGKTGRRFRHFYETSITRNNATNLGELFLLDDKKVMPLQAADMYAAFVRNIMSTVSLANSYDTCLASMKSFWFEITPSVIFQLADRLNAYRSGQFIPLSGIGAKLGPSC